jgi:ureidoacrylate peracid hydrolase
MASNVAPKLLTSLEERLTLGRCALLIVDMQNDFCAEGGYISRMGRSVADYPQLVPRLQRLLKSARDNRVPVVWLAAEYEHDLMPRAMLARQLEAGITDVCCARDSWGAAFFGVAPEPGEPTIKKHSFSGFHETTLQAQLEAWGTETLIVAGVQTNVCVDSTVREAHSRGYYAVVPRDCVLSHMSAEHERVLDTIGFLLGDVTDSEVVDRIWAAHADRPSNLQRREGASP